MNTKASSQRELGRETGTGLVKSRIPAGQLEVERLHDSPGLSPAATFRMQGRPGKLMLRPAAV